MADYSYQKQAAIKVLENALNKSYIASVLAACPSAGKSTIIIEVINLYLEKFPTAKVVVFTHNLNVLKDQMLDSFATGFISPNFTYGDFNTSSQVKVGVIASANTLTEKIDLVIFDEAHQYYLKNMANKAIELLNPEHKILMTGTPSFYNEHNSKNYKKYGMHYISAEELVNMGVFSNVIVDVATGNDLVSKLERSLYLAQKHGMSLDKIIVATKNISEANKIGEYLKQKGRTVAVSTSENDSDNSAINDYKKDKYNTLVIVNKGVLGFSDNKTTGLIDLRASNDVDARSQIFARVLRKHPENIKKFYISGVDHKQKEKEIGFIKKVVSLNMRSVFTKYYY